MGTALALLLTGCAPAGEPSSLPSAAAPAPTVYTEYIHQAHTPGPAVYTDDTHLEPRPTPAPDLYPRWHGQFTDHLIPSPDYGPLIPFSGAPIADPWDFGGGYSLTGLMTLEGKVVVDPVYASVQPLGWGGDLEFGGMEGFHGAMLLSRYTGDAAQEPLFGAYDRVLSQLCAADGSWVTERAYRFVYTVLCYGSVPPDGGLFGLRDGSVLVLLDMGTGEERFSMPLEGYTEEELPSLYDPARVHIGSFNGLGRDPVTGETYFTAVTEAGYVLCDLDGEILFRFDASPGWCRLYGGRCLCTGSQGDRRVVTLLSPNGETLFRKTFFSFND